MNTVHIAKMLMKCFESFPVSPEEKIAECNELFRHPLFSNASELKRKEIMLESSNNKYKSEIEYPWDNYFGINLKPLLRGKVVLDLGCFTGGRAVAWYERYQFSHIVGVDIDSIYIEAAKQFADLRNVPSDFKLAKGEFLPFEDKTFDAVLSFDVFEHVQSLQKTLDECYRVLKNGGRLFVVFPSYWHPFEHHMRVVTKLPLIHYIFSGRTLVRAIYEILEERGIEASWYKRESPHLQPWEKGNTINGTTIALFRKFIKNRHWKIILHSRKPIGSVGRNIQRRTLLNLISRTFYPLTFLPVFEDIFLHRITLILEKTQTVSAATCTTDLSSKP